MRGDSANPRSFGSSPSHRYWSGCKVSESGYAKEISKLISLVNLRPTKSPSTTTCPFTTRIGTVVVAGA